MTKNTAKGLQHPSVYDKIHKQSYHIFRLSCDMLQNRKYGLTWGYVINNSGVQHPDLHLNWKSKVQPRVEGPSKKGAANHGPVRPLRSYVGYVLSETVAAPFNRVKLLIQNQNEMLKQGRLIEPYRGSDQCFARTIRVEGYRSLWRGNTANIIGCVTTKALEATLNDYLERNFSKLKKDNVKNLESFFKWVGWNAVADSVVGVSPLLFVYPLDYAHTRFANDIKASPHFGCSLDTANKNGGNIGHKYQRQFNGLIDVYKKTLNSDGIAGLYRGFSVSCLGTIVHAGVFSVTYASLVPLIFGFKLLQDNSYNRLMVRYGIIAAAGLAYHPFDTVRRRMMMTSREAFKYKNSWDAFIQIVENEGAKSLFKGVGATFLHSIVRSVVLFGYLSLTHRKERRS